MSTSTSFPHRVAKLRAHASVLLGSRPSGTACVRLVIELIDLEPHALVSELPLDVQLLRLVHRAAEPLLQLLRTAPDPDDPLAGLGRQERQAFVLREVEGLDIAAFARVMEVAPSVAARAHMEAVRLLNERATVAQAASGGTEKALADGTEPMLVGPLHDIEA